MKYKFRYVDGLVPKKRDVTLLRGTVIHESFEKLYNQKPMADVLSDIITIYDKAIANATLNDREDYIIGKHMVYGMFKYYPFKDDEFEEIIPEEKFNVRIDGLRQMRLLGKVDGRVKRKGQWWLREVKTTSSNFVQAENRARVSYQGSGYIYGEQRQLGLLIQGILFDFLRTSLLRKGVNESAKEFGERILKDYENHMLDSKDGHTLRESRMYRRYFSYRSLHEIREYEKDIVKAAKKIRTCTRKGDWMRNPDACYFYNKECPYMKICWLSRVDPAMLRAYYDRTNANPELA